MSQIIPQHNFQAKVMMQCKSQNDSKECIQNREKQQRNAKQVSILLDELFFEDFVDDDDDDDFMDVCDFEE